MTKLLYAWSNSETNSRKFFLTYPEVSDYQKIHGGVFKAHYIEGKDVDYCLPNPNTKRYANRLVAC